MGARESQGNSYHKWGESMKRNGKIGESVLALRWELETATEEVGGGVPELGGSLGEDSAMEVSGRGGEEMQRTLPRVGVAARAR